MRRYGWVMLLVACFPARASADGSFRGERLESGFLFELSVDGGIGPRATDQTGLSGRVTLRPLFAAANVRARDDTRMIVGSYLGVEVPVHVLFNASVAGPDRPDIMVGIAPGSAYELEDARLRVPSVAGAFVPEAGIFIPTTVVEPLPYLGWSYTVSGRLNAADDDVRLAADIRLSAYFIIENDDQLTFLGSLSLGVTLY